MRVTRDALSLGRFNYIGLNISYACQTLFLGTVTSELTADVEIFGPDNALIGGSGGGRVGATETMQTGGDFERSLYFAPLSAQDRGVYRCTGTIRPVNANALVSNGRGNKSQEISVFG